jgi:hypothetical protein
LGRFACAGKEERKGQPAWDFVGWARRIGREGEREFVCFLFFSNFFQIHFSNIHTQIKQKSMHSNHDAQALIFSKLF